MNGKKVLIINIFDEKDSDRIIESERIVEIPSLLEEDGFHVNQDAINIIRMCLQGGKMIKTNRVKLNIHYDHIMRDYDIYKLYIKQNGESSDGWSVVRKSLETLANHLSPALAVLYRKTGITYALFEKGNVCLDEFQSHVDQNGHGILVDKVDLNDRLSMRPNEVCQLVLNSLPNMDVSKNLTIYRANYSILIKNHLKMIL